MQQTDIKEAENIVSCCFTFSLNDSKYSQSLQDIISYLLYDFINKNNLKDANFALQKLDNEFKIFMQCNSDMILSFSDILSLALPISSHFVFKEINKIENIDLSLYSKVIRPESRIPNALDFKGILDKDNMSFFNISEFISFENKDILKDSITPAQIKTIIQNVAERIQHQNEAILQINDRKIKLSKLNSQTRQNMPNVIFSDLYNAQSYLRLNESQKISIASFEKPFVKVAIKDIFIQSFNSNFLFASLPNEPVLILLMSYLQETYSIDYLFLLDCNNETLDLEYKTKYPFIFSDDKIVVSSSGHALSFDKASSFEEILNINKINDKRFITYLSFSHNSLFCIEDNGLKEILNINFSTNLQTHLKRLYNYENGDKLIKNFIKQHQDFIHKWELDSDFLESLGLKSSPNNKGSNELFSNNLLDIFPMIEKLLNLQDSVINLANACVRDRGPRIDYKLIRHNNIVTIDYPRIFRSLMSFYLAGVEAELLCYGIIDSLAEFIGTLSNDMMLNYGVKEIFICGNLLLEQCFLDRISNVIPKNINFNFPLIGSIDF